MLCKQRPCHGCYEAVCPGVECGKWQIWFLEAWSGVNRYAWDQMDRQGRIAPEKFQYELPHMVRSPCVDCLCRAWCDTPCSLRLQWWDRNVGKGRR